MGFETSCDETAVAILRKKNKSTAVDKMSEIVLSQIPMHSKYGGVVPEIASREHLQNIDKITKQALNESKLKLSNIDAFCSTLGPGLLGGLIVGSNYSKTLSLATNKPYYGINHLQAHILVAKMENKLSFPYLCLLVSGGHSLFVIAKKYNQFEVLGETLDDAVGEAYDKTAKILGLGYPGGPEIEKIAKMDQSVEDLKFPRPMFHENDFNLSFSGLKTAVRRIVKDNLKTKEKACVAINFQNAVADCLIKKAELAITYFKKRYSKENAFVLSGGVASNGFLREKFSILCKEKDIKLIVPNPEYCVDNATMVAYCCLERIFNKDDGDLVWASPKPRWGLDQL